MIAIGTILTTVLGALQVAKSISDMLPDSIKPGVLKDAIKIGGEVVDFTNDVLPTLTQAGTLIAKIVKGEEVTQAELDAIQAEGDRLTDIAEKLEAQTPPA